MTHSKGLNIFTHVWKHIELEEDHLKTVGPKGEVHMASSSKITKIRSGRGCDAQSINRNALGVKKERTEVKKRVPLK